MNGLQVVHNMHLNFNFRSNGKLFAWFSMRRGSSNVCILILSRMEINCALIMTYALEVAVDLFDRSIIPFPVSPVSLSKSIEKLYVLDYSLFSFFYIL